MITPFTPEGELDELSTCTVIDFLVDGGVDGIFVGGTTGEAASMSQSMRHQFARRALSHIDHRVRSYVGIGDNCVAQSISAANESFRLGVDAVVAHPPSYYPLTPEELFDYFSLLVREIHGDLLIYNIPITTHLSIPVDIVERLSRNPRIVGMKDSENDIQRAIEVIKRLNGRSDFSLLMGASMLSARALMLGMVGVVPGSANLIPHCWRDLYDSASSGDGNRAEQLQSQANQVATVLQQGRTLGHSLAGVKAAMSAKGLCQATVLPPLRTLTQEQIEEVSQQMRLLQLL